MNFDCFLQSIFFELEYNPSIVFLHQERKFDQYRQNCFALAAQKFDQFYHQLYNREYYCLEIRLGCSAS
jgi:hypothetical protein